MKMGYRKEYNSFAIWKDYCKKNQGLIELLNLPRWVFLKEQNFREFAKTGKINKTNLNHFDFEILEDEVFWKVFYFITNYFDGDGELFTKFEESRLKRQMISNF